MSSPLNRQLSDSKTEMVLNSVEVTALNDLPLISAVIPCYNHAHFLSEAIESVLKQTYPNYEIIVVDDGSTDNTGEVAARYPEVRYIRQDNQGLSGARNTGLQESRGDHLVFLDADDLLLPRALEAGEKCLRAHPECAFVSGHFRYVNEDGSFLNETPQRYVDREHYLAFLQGNYISMHATVMYRRSVFNEVGNYDTSLPACEDYDLYLRIARRFPVHCHDEMVAEYRQHDTNMSGDVCLMLRTVLSVLHTQWPYVKGDRRATKAIRTGMLYWKAGYGEDLFIQATSLKLRQNFRQKALMLLTITRYAPRYFVYHTLMWLVEIGLNILRRITPASVREAVARPIIERVWPPVGGVKFGDLRQTSPLREIADSDAGTPIDQYYVETFLTRQAHHIQATVLEFHADDYTCRFGGDRVRTSNIFELVENKIDPNTESDLTIPHDIPAETYDCIIIPQMLHRIYNLDTTVQTLYRCLKPGGVLLATVPGIGLINDDNPARVGYWAFTEKAVHQLFAPVFGTGNIKTQAYGNVLAASAFYHNLASNELAQTKLDHQDDQYQLLITIRAIKV